MENILILDDHRHMRELLSGLLAEVFPDCSVIEAATLEQARQQVRKIRFSIAVIDMRLPDGRGTEFLREIKQTHPDTFCVVVTAYDDDAYLFDALKAGAQGYLLKEHSREKLVHLFRRILKCEPPISPSIARRMLKHFQYQESERSDVLLASDPTDNNVRKGHLKFASPSSVLTKREREVLAYIAKGMTCPETADFLGIKRSTAAGYVKNIYQKLNISSRAEAALEAERMGLFYE